jgi:hypothetical protein
MVIKTLDPDWIRIRIRIHLKCWIRISIRIKWFRFQNRTLVPRTSVVWNETLQYSYVSSRVANPHPLNADPDQASLSLYYGSGTGSSFFTNADLDPDLAPHQNGANLRPLFNRSSLQGSILSLKGSILSRQASIVSVHAPPRLCFVPLLAGFGSSFQN